MKKELDRSKRYNFSDIPKEMEEKVLEVIKNSSRMPWEINGFNVNRKDGSLKFGRNDWYFQSNFGKDDLTFESLLDLEDVQVDCRELTEEQIKDLINVVKNELSPSNDFFDADEASFYFSINKYCNLFGFYGIDKEQTVITYEKFMELFEESKSGGIK